MKKVWKKFFVTLTAVAAACSMLAAPVSAGWKQTGPQWWYQNDDGSFPKSGWASISDRWYLFDDEGYMLTGWQQVDGDWYYLSSSGAMATGWKQLGNTWYYLGGGGVMKTGWQQIGGTWYYFEDWGGMVTGTKTIGGKSYTFSSSGAWTGEETGSTSSGGSSSNSGSTAPAGETKVVFWGVTGTKYHIDPYCRSFQGKAANSGTLAQAKAAGREDWCNICSKGWTDEQLLEQGNPNVK